MGGLSEGSEDDRGSEMCFLLVNSGVEVSGFRLEMGRKQVAGSIASVEDVEWAWRGNEGGRRSGEHEVRLISSKL